MIFIKKKLFKRHEVKEHSSCIELVSAQQDEVVTVEFQFIDLSGTHIETSKFNFLRQNTEI